MYPYCRDNFGISVVIEESPSDRQIYIDTSQFKRNTNKLNSTTALVITGKGSDSFSIMGGSFSGYVSL